MLESSLQIAANEGIQLRCCLQELESKQTDELAKLGESDKKLAALIHEYAVLKSTDIIIIKREAGAAMIVVKQATQPTTRTNKSTNSDQQQEREANSHQAEIASATPLAQAHILALKADIVKLLA